MKGVPMTIAAQLQEELDCTSLNRGSIIDIETKNRHYWIEYLGDDVIRISGHPRLCPTPVLAKFHGSINHEGVFKAGFIGKGTHLVFRPLDESLPIATSEITKIRVEGSQIF